MEGRPLAGPPSPVGAVLGLARWRAGALARRRDGRRVAWRLSWEERRHHAFLAGASGSGKSTTLLRLALDDLDAGRLVVVVDPQGDLAERIAAVRPGGGAAGLEGLTVVDPRRTDTAPLDLLDPDPGRATAHLMSAVTEVWPSDFSGPVWQRGISLSLRVLAALEIPLSLALLERYISDPVWRNEIVAELPPGPLATEALSSRATGGASRRATAR